MGLSTSSRAPLQRQPVARPPRPSHPTPHGAVTSRTVRQGEVLDAPHGWAWVKRPDPLPDGRAGWQAGLLLIDGTVYDTHAFVTADGDTGHVWVIVDLLKSDGTHYRLCIGKGEAVCDCPHATYRGLRCKHESAVVAALASLEDRERGEWELERAESTLGAA